MIVIYNHRWQTHLLRFPISNCCCFTHRIHHVDPPHPLGAHSLRWVVGRSPISTEFHGFQATSSSPLITPLRLTCSHHRGGLVQMIIFLCNKKTPILRCSNQPTESSRGVNKKRLPFLKFHSPTCWGWFFFSERLWPELGSGSSQQWCEAIQVGKR